MSGKHCTENLVGLRTVVDATEKRRNLLSLPGIEPPYLKRPVSNVTTVSVELSQLLPNKLKKGLCELSNIRIIRPCA
jgi:hypothetical protein